MPTEQSQHFVDVLRQRFPIRAVSNRVRVTEGRSFWMDVDLTLSVNGRIDVTWVVESKMAFAGFHGQAEFRFKDDRGNVLQYQATGREAAGATWEPFPSYRRLTWTSSLPFEVLVLTYSIEIICTERPIDGFALAQKNLELATAVVTSAKKLISEKGGIAEEVEQLATGS